jgi:hypothetical protein
MTPGQLLQSPPALEELDASISIRTLQLALLQQQYAPNHHLFSKNPLMMTPTAELAGLNVSSDFGSDKVTLGDATSVCSPGALMVDSRRSLCSSVADANVAVVVVGADGKGEGA